MSVRKKLLIIIGSASTNSASHKLVHYFVEQTADIFDCIVFDHLKSLPHFSPEASVENTPESIVSFRQQIAEADAVLICTPEYIFSIPSGLKNAIEWCVSTTIFTDKKVGIITASAHGAKGHEELKMIMRTIGAVISDETSLLIQGIKGKIDVRGKLLHDATSKSFHDFIAVFKSLLS